MEKLQAKAGGAPHGGTPGSSPAPPSPQSQQLSARPPAGASSPSAAAQHKTERLVTDVNGTGEPHQATTTQHAAPTLQTAASLSDMQEQPAFPVSLLASMLMPRDNSWTHVLKMSAGNHFTLPFKVLAIKVITLVLEREAAQF